MTERELVFAWVLGVWAVNLLLPVVLGLVCTWWDFVSRSSTEHRLGRKYQCLKYRGLGEAVDDQDDVSDHALAWLVLDLLVLGVVSVIVAIFIVHAPVIGTILLVLAVSPLVVRGCVDICRTLRMNWNTGDSERLAALEAEINKLKGKK